MNVQFINDVAIMDQDRCIASQYIVRVALDPALPAFSQVSGVLTVRRSPWLYADVRGCCRHYCRQRSRPTWLHEALGEVVHRPVGRMEVLGPQPPTVSHDGGCAGQSPVTCVSLSPHRHQPRCPCRHGLSQRRALAYETAVRLARGSPLCRPDLDPLGVRAEWPVGVASGAADRSGRRSPAAGARRPASAGRP
jgi:hypothetical protein